MALRASLRHQGHTAVLQAMRAYCKLAPPVAVPAGAMDELDEIHLRGLMFHGYHGVYPEVYLLHTFSSQHALNHDLACPRPTCAHATLSCLAAHISMATTIHVASCHDYNADCHASGASALQLRITSNITELSSEYLLHLCTGEQAGTEVRSRCHATLRPAVSRRIRRPAPHSKLRRRARVSAQHECVLMLTRCDAAASTNSHERHPMAGSHLGTTTLADMLHTLSPAGRASPAMCCPSTHCKQSLHAIWQPASCLEAAMVRAGRYVHEPRCRL